MSSTTPFCLNVKVVVKPSRREEFLTTIRSDQKGTLEDEAGSLQFLLIQDSTNENQFYFHEEYVNYEAFVAHMAAPHFAPWRAFSLTDPFDAIIEVNLYEGVGELEEITNTKRSIVSSTEGEKFCVWVNLFPSNNKLDDFKTCIAGNKIGTDSTEEKALQYVWGENFKPEFKGSFHFFEVYAGEDGFKEHTASSHFKVWEEFAGNEGSFEKEPEVCFGRII